MEKQGKWPNVPKQSAAGMNLGIFTDPATLRQKENKPIMLDAALAVK